MEKLLRDIMNYQGTDISYRGIIDSIKMIVLNISNGLPENSSYINNFFINDYSMYSCIKKISIDANCCCISYIDEDNNINQVCFSSIFFDTEYRAKIFNYEQLISMGYSDEDAKAYDDKYIYKTRCHEVTLDYLVNNMDISDVCAVTSLCINNNNILFYHSYIWDKRDNMVYDYARNICMSKDIFDTLFVYKEINILNYEQFVRYYKECDCCNEYYSLYYLALITLYNEQIGKANESSISNKCLVKELVS